MQVTAGDAVECVLHFASESWTAPQLGQLDASHSFSIKLSVIWQFSLKVILYVSLTGTSPF